jgi:hypothetical protein
MDEQLPPTQYDETLAWFFAGLIPAVLGYFIYCCVLFIQCLLDCGSE